MMSSVVAVHREHPSDKGFLLSFRLGAAHRELKQTHLAFDRAEGPVCAQSVQHAVQEMRPSTYSMRVFRDDSEHEICIFLH